MAFRLPLDGYQHLAHERVQAVVKDVFRDGGLDGEYGQRLLHAFNRSLLPASASSPIRNLPVLACQASGGDPHRALPVLAAWQVVCLALKLLDDVEDGDISDDIAEHINTATGLLVASPLLLQKVFQEDGFRLNERLTSELQCAVLHACAGQHADLQVNQAGVNDIDPDAWLRIALAKSGALFSWATWAGALVAHADNRILSCYREYGRHLGVLLQIADDLNDVWYPKASNDLHTGRLSLPVCYALTVTRGEARERLEALRQRARSGDIAAEDDLRRVLTELGALHYLAVAARVQYHQALQALEQAGDRSQADHLVALLDDLLLPLTV